MFPVIDLGPFAIQAPGLILILSLFFGVWLTGKLADTLGANGEAIENAFLIGLVSGILSARIGFLLQTPAIFLENPLSLVSLTPSMLNPGFGVLVGGLAALIFAQKKRLPLWPTLDTLTPLILMVFMGVHLANFASGDAYGLPTSLPWAIRIWGDFRHPVQLYTLVLSLILCIWFWVKTQGLRTTGYLQSGALTLVIVAALAAITVFTRAFVAEKSLFWRLDGIQVSAFLLLALDLWLIYRKMIAFEQSAHVFISLGSNLNPRENLRLGFDHLSTQFKIKRFSSIYQTTDVRSQKNAKTYLNQVVEIETSQSFPRLRESLKSIEAELGRERGNQKVVPLDLDILTFDQEVFISDHHQIPDPDLIKYHYLAKPLAEMAPDFRHPANGKSIQQILLEIKDKNQVKKIKEVDNGTSK